MDNLEDIVSEERLARGIPRAVVRTELPYSCFIIVDNDYISLCGQPHFSIPDIQIIERPGQKLSVYEVLDFARSEFGYNDPFLIRLPKNILEKQGDDRIISLKQFAFAYIEEEQKRENFRMNMIKISPIFGGVNFTLNTRLVFVLMPFDADLDGVYKGIVKKAVKEDCGLVCRRADEYNSNKAILEDIWKAIYELRIVIADMTRNNPNVMYELGISHTIGKDTILIRQTGTDSHKLPFDLAHIRRIDYNNNAEGGASLRSKLTETIKAVIVGSII